MMPPKKQVAAAASPAAKKRLAPHPAKKKQPLQQGDDAPPPTAAGGDATPTTEGEHAESFPEKEEEQAEEAAAAAVTVDNRDAPPSAGDGEVNNGSSAAALVVKVDVGEGRDAASALLEKGQDQDALVAAAGEEEADEAAAAEDAVAAKGDIAEPQEEEEEATAAASGLAAKGEGAGVVAENMEVEDGPGVRTPSTAAHAHSDAIPAAASAVAVLPPSSPVQMGPPSLSVSHGVDELRGLSTALSTFIRCWDRLSHHLDSIQASLDTLSRAHLPPPTPATQGKWRQEEMVKREADEEKKGRADVIGEAEAKAGAEEQAKKREQPQKTPPLDLESICEKMLGRNLRRYVVAHMSDVDRLREEVPRALRLAPVPAKLVLSCIGRFYLQGSKAYADPNSPMVSVRRACILVLEFFLLSGCPFSGGVHLSSSPSDATTATDAARTDVAEGKEEKPSASVVEEAKVAALAWKNRLVAEGGVASASAVDALGLALFVASFGIPSDFDSEMMYDVFRLCNMKKKADILRRSPIIGEKLPDIIQDLVQKEKYISAADLACGFGLQEKYPPLDLISSFLIKANAAAKEGKGGQSSVRSPKEVTANQLAAYKSVVKCLEDHKLDPSSLASFKIEEKISKLEKDVAKFEKKLKDKNLKRKAEDVEVTNEVKGPAKRTAHTPAKATSRNLPPQVVPTQDHGRALSLSRNLYSGSINRFSGLLDAGGVGNMAGNVYGPTGAGGRLAATGSGYSVGNGILPSAERWHREGAVGDNSVRRSYAGMGHSGQKGLIDPPLLAGSSLGMGSRATGSSLYEFADNVMENELYYGRVVGSSALSNSALGYR